MDDKYIDAVGDEMNSWKKNADARMSMTNPKISRLPQGFISLARFMNDCNY